MLKEVREGWNLDNQYFIYLFTFIAGACTKGFFDASSGRGGSMKMNGIGFLISVGVCLYFLQG